MRDKIKKCLFCDTASIEAMHLGIKDAYRVDCPLCMSYIVSETAIMDKTIDAIPKEDRILFSAHLRNSYAEGHIPEILSATIVAIPEIVSPYKRLTPMDKANKVIFYLGESSDFFGHPIKIDMERDYTKFYCKNTDEFVNVRYYLIEEKIVEFANVPQLFTLTMKGWNKTESLKEINIDSKRVFVAMNFDAKLKNIFDDAIYPACKECGFEAFRVDTEEHNEKICDKIISDIKSSRFLIADFTEQKYGVYFEAGFAQGLGIKVIWTCNEKEKDGLHFDTRQYNHIFWKDTEDLRIQLANRIKATVL